jgi:threonine aldolase
MKNQVASIHRRRFLQLGGLSTAAVALPVSSSVAAVAAPAEDRTVRLSGDGVGLSPAQYAALLHRLVDEHNIVPDSYSLGGVVEELEAQCARILGKERAIFMPTGTLANHMAVRALAGGSGRVVVQEESHLYQDEGDCAQTLSNLTLMPLAAGRATFTAEELQRVIEQTKGGRVVSRLSAISIETPVRRKQGERFEPVELEKVIGIARREGIRLHLDGARMFLESGYSGVGVADYARPFDTVYVSLYKYFNAASGAMLAGPKEIIDGMYHGRRMFGGGLNHAWPFALVALHYLDGFGDRFAKAVKTSEDFIRALRQHDRFAVERVPLGTNLFRLQVRGTDPAAFQKRLAAAGIMLPAAQRDTFLVGVNETLNHTSAAQLSEAFVRALAG